MPVLSVPTDDPQLCLFCGARLLPPCSHFFSLVRVKTRPFVYHIFIYTPTTSRAWILRTLRGCPSSPPGRRRRSPPTARKGRRWPPRSSSAPPQETRRGRQAFFFFCYVCMYLFRFWWLELKLLTCARKSRPATLRHDALSVSYPVRDECQYVDMRINPSADASIYTQTVICDVTCYRFNNQLT